MYLLIYFRVTTSDFVIVNVIIIIYPGPAVTVAVVLARAAQVRLWLLQVGHRAIARLTIQTELGCGCEVNGGGSQNVTGRMSLLQQSREEKMLRNKSNLTDRLGGSSNLQDPLIVFASLSAACRTRCLLLVWHVVSVYDYVYQHACSGNGLLGGNLRGTIPDAACAQTHARTQTQSTRIQLFHFCAKKELQYLFFLYLFFYSFLRALLQEF